MILLISPKGLKIWFTYDGPDRCFFQGYRPESGWEEEGSIDLQVARAMIPAMTSAGWNVSPSSPCTVFEFSDLMETA